MKFPHHPEFNVDLLSISLAVVIPLLFRAKQIIYIINTAVTVPLFPF